MPLTFESFAPVRSGDDFVLAGGTVSCEISPGDRWVCAVSSNATHTDALFRVEGEDLQVSMYLLDGGVKTLQAQDDFPAGDYHYRVTNDQIAGKSIILEADGRNAVMAV
jgi:hypothetical protein